MRKKYLILPIILSLFSILYAGAPDTLWTRTYGGDSTDVGRSVQQTSDGGFIIAGYTNSFGSGGNDVYLIRTDLNGDTLWTRTYGGDSADMGYCIDITSDGGFIIVGETKSFGDTLSDVYLIRTNSTGDTLWTRTYGGVDSDVGSSVQQTSDGGFIIVGTHLIKTSSNGDTVWTNNTISGNSVQQTSDGGFIILSGSMYLHRTDSDGDTLWKKGYYFASELRKSGYSLDQTFDGGFIITGHLTCYEDFPDWIQWDEVPILRTNSAGDKLWSNTPTQFEYAVGYSVQQTYDGGFIVAGNSYIHLAGQYNVYILRTNSNGDTLWTRTFDVGYVDKGYSVQQTDDGGFIIAGNTEFSDVRGEEVYLIRLDKDSTEIQEEIPSNFLKPNDFIVSYNHENNLISIRYNLLYSTSVKLEAYDIKGRLVKVITDKFMQKGSYCVNLDSKRFGSGVYYIKLSMENNKAVKKFLVAK